MGTYRIDRSYHWNYEAGPQYRGPFPPVPETPWKEFFGIPVRSRIGISAGILLNSRWIEVYARLGFDLLTYKTVRSAARRAYPLPNWVFLEEEEPLDPRRPGEVLHLRRRRPRDPSRSTAAVSFGMPSQDPRVWTRDVRRARKLLPPGKALIVSVVASPGPGTGERELVLDFARLAAEAREAGAQVVEANLSCPNVKSAEGHVQNDPALSRRVMEEMKRAAGAPVVAKAGSFVEKRALRAFLRAVDGRAEGVLLINAVSRRVAGPRGRPAFGRGREVCGVIGRGIQAQGLSSLKAAREVVSRDRLSLRVLAVGGVTRPADPGPCFEAGAYAVLMGGAPMYDPHLAIQMKSEHPEW